MLTSLQYAPLAQQQQGLKIHGRLAQLGEHRPYKASTGSSPSMSKIHSSNLIIDCNN